MAYRLNLSDGTTTVDLYDGSDAQVREGGLRMPPPNTKPEYVSNPFADGARLASCTYDNRTIEIDCKIWGSSLSDLKTNIRTIQRLLNDAKAHTLSGYGAQVYLEYQWGDSADESTFFDILRGDLVLPNNYLSSPLANSYYITNATIKLTCKPFGRYTNQDIAQETLENSQSTRDIQISYLVDDDTRYDISGANWAAQTFTTTGAFTAVGAAIKCYAAGDAGTLTIAIRATSAGHPTGANLASGTYDISNMPTNTAHFGYTYVAFSVPVALSAATKYALVAYCSGGDAANYVAWRYDNADGALADGNREYSTDTGSSWSSDATDDYLFAVYAAETQLNYQDITTTEAYGDVPARLYLKIAQSGAAGSHKIWIAKRSGTRQADDLWYEAEGNDSFTNSIGGSHDVSELEQADTTASNELYKEIVVVPDGNIAADSELGYLTYSFYGDGAIEGQFRVLVRVKTDCLDNADYDHLSFGVGYSYGMVTKTPSEASGEYYQCSGENSWETLDLGLINIPPIADSDIATNSAYNLNIYLYATELLTTGEYYKIDLDWIFLLPIDEGVVIVDDVSSAYSLTVDSITDPPAVFTSAAGAILDCPDYVGYPFTLGRESTRIYILRNEAKSITFALDTKYQPQFLLI